MKFNTIEEIFSWLEKKDPISITSLSDGTCSVAFVIHSDEQIIDLIRDENVGLEIMQGGIAQYIMRDYSNNNWSLVPSV